MSQIQSIEDQAVDKGVAIKEKFNQEMLAMLKKSFELTENDLIEMRGMTRRQIEYLIDIFGNKKKKTKSYYHFSSLYLVKAFEGVNYL